MMFIKIWINTLFDIPYFMLSNGHIRLEKINKQQTLY